MWDGDDGEAENTHSPDLLLTLGFTWDQTKNSKSSPCSILGAVTYPYILSFIYGRCVDSVKALIGDV